MIENINSRQLTHELNHVVFRMEKKCFWHVEATDIVR